MNLYQQLVCPKLFWNLVYHRNCSFCTARNSLKFWACAQFIAHSVITSRLSYLFLEYMSSDLHTPLNRSAHRLAKRRGQPAVNQLSVLEWPWHSLSVGACPACQGKSSDSCRYREFRICSGFEPQHWWSLQCLYILIDRIIIYERTCDGSVSFLDTAQVGHESLSLPPVPQSPSCNQLSHVDLFFTFLENFCFAIGYKFCHMSWKQCTRCVYAVKSSQVFEMGGRGTEIDTASLPVRIFWRPFRRRYRQNQRQSDGGVVRDWGGMGYMILVT